jgi:4-hydroxy-tetrahydrodipicolinate synthase
VSASVLRGVIAAIATANCNADLCARAWQKGDAEALAQAVRGLFEGKPLVAGVKALLAHIHADTALATLRPPLAGHPRPTARRSWPYERIRAAKMA